MKRLALTLLLALGACTEPPAGPAAHWSGSDAGAGEKAFQTARMTCMGYAHGRLGRYDKSQMIACMAAYGWQQDTNGPFTAPPGAGVRMD